MPHDRSRTLAKTIFFAYHTSGTGAHMGAYNTLLRIRLHFFCPSMRKHIIAWARSCTECIPAANWKRVNTGLLRSWPALSSFTIISIDIWKPGNVVNIEGSVALLDVICDMTQVVVVTPARSLESSHIARCFMESVLLKFGLRVVVVVDKGKEFCELFQTMC